MTPWPSEKVALLYWGFILEDYHTHLHILSVRYPWLCLWDKRFSHVLDQGIRADARKRKGSQVARGRVICNAVFQLEHSVTYRQPQLGVDLFSVETICKQIPGVLFKVISKEWGPGKTWE